MSYWGHWKSQTNRWKMCQGLDWTSLFWWDFFWKKPQSIQFKFFHKSSRCHWQLHWVWRKDCTSVTSNLNSYLIKTDFNFILIYYQAVCERIGIQIKGFDVGNRKRKFLVSHLPDMNVCFIFILCLLICLFTVWKMVLICLEISSLSRF